MSASELTAAIKARRNVTVGQGVDYETVSRAESLLGSLPEDYRQFLQDVGWVVIGSQEVFGLGADTPPFMNIVEVHGIETQDGGLPASLVPIHADGGGNYACIDTRAQAGSGMNVVFWAHDSRPAIAPLALSFTDWMVDLMANEQDD